MKYSNVKSFREFCPVSVRWRSNNCCHQFLFPVKTITVNVRTLLRVLPRFQERRHFYFIFTTFLISLWKSDEMNFSQMWVRLKRYFIVLVFCQSVSVYWVMILKKNTKTRDNARPLPLPLVSQDFFHLKKIILCTMCTDNIMNNLSRLPNRIFLYCLSDPWPLTCTKLQN